MTRRGWEPSGATIRMPLLCCTNCNLRWTGRADEFHLTHPQTCRRCGKFMSPMKIGTAEKET